MSYWPYITIAITLFLILVFRRLDKRTINFQKFKRYAEKLSSDFNAFLRGRREELETALSQLSAAVKRADEVLARLKESEGDLVREHADVEKIRIELDSLGKEYEKYRTLKSELSEEVTRLSGSLPSLQKMSHRIQKIGLDIVENEKALRNISAVIPGLERRIEERTDSVLADARSLIIEEAKRSLQPIADEFKQNLELLRDAGQNHFAQFRRDADDALRQAKTDIAALARDIETSSERMTRIESEGLTLLEKQVEGLGATLDGIRGRIENLEQETTESYLSRAEEQFQRFSLLLEESQGQYREEIFERIENRAKDLSGYVTRLEGRVQSLLDEIEKDTDRMKEEIRLQSREQQSEIERVKESLLVDINEEANRNMLLIKPISTEMGEKLQAFKREFTTVSGELRLKLESQDRRVAATIEGFTGSLEAEKNRIVEELQGRVTDITGQMRSLGQKLEGMAFKATEEISRRYVGRLKEYEKAVRGLEGRIGDLKEIADAGQRMLEERIDRVFQDYRPDVDSKMSQILEDTERLFDEKKESLLKRVEDLIEESNSSLADREREISSYLGRVDKQIENAQNQAGEHEEALRESLKSFRIEAREDLVSELESLKKLFREEKERVLSGYSGEITAFGERLQELSVRLDGVRDRIDERVENAVRDVGESIKGMETSYLKTEEDVQLQARKDLEGFTHQLEDIRGRIETMQKELFADVTASIDRFKRDIEQEFGDQRQSAADRQREMYDYITRITEDAKANIEGSYREAQVILGGFQDEVAQVQDKMEKRVDDLERRIREFEKESVVLKRAAKFKERVESDINAFSDILVQLKEDKKDIMSMQKVMANLKRDEGEISARVRQLKSDKQLVQEISKNAEQAIGLITLVDEKIKHIESQRDIVERIDREMGRLTDQLDALKKQSEALALNEKDIQLSIETVTKTKDFISNLEQRTEMLNAAFGEFKEREEDIRKKLVYVEEKSSGLTADERRIEEVLSRFKEMDALVSDIEQRTKQLQSTREWLARTESRLTNLTQDADRLVQALSATGGLPVGAPTGRPAGPGGAQGGEGGAHDGPTLLSREAESKVKTVLTLFEQKWTIPEICKVTKMSRGEVELILELNNR